jgi:ATP-dependent DNA ligase
VQQGAGIRRWRLHGAAWESDRFWRIAARLLLRREARLGGKVGTGFDRATLGRLGKKLAALRTPISPFDGQGLPRSGVHWVKPKLVAQIAFTEWTRDDKLRHPRFLGLREDKKPQEVMREG